MRTRALRFARRLLVVATGLAGCGSPTQPSAPYSQIDLVIGTGTQALIGSVATVDYTGWLYDSSKADNKGKMFDSSLGGAPLVFVVGSGQVISGFDQGVRGMRVGGSRRIVVPWEQGFGVIGSADGAVPPRTNLVFEITLLGVS